MAITLIFLTYPKQRTVFHHAITIIYESNVCPITCFIINIYLVNTYTNGVGALIVIILGNAHLFLDKKTRYVRVLHIRRRLISIT